MKCYGASKIGLPTWNKGISLSPEHIEKLSKSHMGVKMPTRSVEHRKKIGLAHSGSKSPFWKGGVSEENKRIRASLNFKLWRESVFKRDNWTCQECNIRGNELHPHHIKPFALFPELRFAIDNGITLCAPCHRKTDTYGKSFNTLREKSYDI